MTALYPIGTQLITRRLSQAALYQELFPYSSTEFASFFDPNDERDERHLVGFCLSADEWRVMVTAENQKWLIPVPILRDGLEYPRGSGRLGWGWCASLNLGLATQTATLRQGDDTREVPLEQITRIIERTYPNGQRAPLIEWDEVLLPEGAIA